jgi:hypothetical protein
MFLEFISLLRRALQLPGTLYGVQQAAIEAGTQRLYAKLCQAHRRRRSVLHCDCAIHDNVGGLVHAQPVDGGEEQRGGQDGRKREKDAKRSATPAIANRPAATREPHRACETTDDSPRRLAR